MIGPNLIGIIVFSPANQQNRVYQGMSRLLCLTVPGRCLFKEFQSQLEHKDPSKCVCVIFHPCVGAFLPYFKVKIA